MDSSAFKIHGADNIERHISTMLRQAEKRLEASCDPIAAEMLLTVLEGANYICLDLVKPKQDGSLSLTVPVLEALRWFIVALDPLLRLTHGTIRAPNLESFKAISERIIVIIYAIGQIEYWRRVQEVHRLAPMQFVIADGDRFLDPEPPEFYEALSEVMTKLGADQGWRKWFTEQILHPRWEKIEPLYNQAFQQYYGLHASDFVTLEAYFRSVAQSHSEMVTSLQIPRLESNKLDIDLSMGFPQAMNIVLGILQGAMPAKKMPRFTPLALREQVLADLQSEMRNGKEKAQKWLEVLEYHPGRDIFRHPIIPLIENGQWIYSLFPWAFYPAQICSEQWDGELFLLPKPRSKWAKTIGQWYGDGFRDYVVEMLRAIGIVDLFIERGISRTEFGDQLARWLKRLPKINKKVHKNEFRPDIILQKGDMALVISCKAEDLYFDYWLLHNYLFMPASKIKEAIKRDIIALREVSVWGECIASMERIQQRLGLQVKRILPILVTARKEPLGSPVLRRHLAQRQAIPRVPAVTTDELKQFITSGLDMSVLPLPDPPQLFMMR
ncbi:hypothetical protein M1O17_00210 [Dehalococcoidia bacterium]|nr:hypothetical protein [Dehalococcoidia bacterium]